MIELVLGGARSGKSAYAESLAISSGLQLFYVATATALDDEMKRRVIHHQAQRSADWETIEESVHLASVLQQYDHVQHCILVDCLTLWLSNNLLHDDSSGWEQQKNALLNVLPNLKAKVILVSNEVGQGIVPLGEINRKFVDEAGWLHQSIATVADKVVFVTAGLPMIIKDINKTNEIGL